MRILLICLILLLLNSCSKEEILVDDDSSQNRITDCQKRFSFSNDNLSAYEEFQKHKSLWDCIGYHTYALVMEQKGQMCQNGKHLIIVENNEIDSVKLINGSSDTIGCQFYSINSFFDKIETALDPNKPIDELAHIFPDTSIFVAHQAEIYYNPEFGFPVLGIFDYVYDMPDLEYEFFIPTFRTTEE